jgi:hypothetical protein
VPVWAGVDPPLRCWGRKRPPLPLMWRDKAVAKCQIFYPDELPELALEKYLGLMDCHSSPRLQLLGGSGLGGGLKLSVADDTAAGFTSMLSSVLRMRLASFLSARPS